MNYRKQESLVPPDLLQVLLRPISEAGVALTRLDERIARFDGSWLVPVNYGTTTLTADCGGFTAQCTVTVVRPEEQP